MRGEEGERSEMQRGRVQRRGRERARVDLRIVALESFEVGAVLESGKTLSGAAMRIRITAPFALLRPTLVSPLGEALRISST